jgi:aldose 1-epimerase
VPHPADQLPIGLVDRDGAPLHGRAGAFVEFRAQGAVVRARLPHQIHRGRSHRLDVQLQRRVDLRPVRDQHRHHRVRIRGARQLPGRRLLGGLEVAAVGDRRAQPGQRGLRLGVDRGHQERDRPQQCHPLRGRPAHHVFRTGTARAAQRRPPAQVGRVDPLARLDLWDTRADRMRAAVPVDLGGGLRPLAGAELVVRLDVDAVAGGVEIGRAVRNPAQPGVGQPGGPHPQHLAFGRGVEHAGQVDLDRDGPHHIADDGDRCRERDPGDLLDLPPLRGVDPAAHPGELAGLHEVALPFLGEYRVGGSHENVVRRPEVGLDRAHRVQPGRHRGPGQQGEAGGRDGDHRQQRERSAGSRPPLSHGHPQHRRGPPPPGPAASHRFLLTFTMNFASLEESVDRHVIGNAHGMRARILTYGGIVQSLEVPDRNGETADVVLGFDELQGYLDHPDPYFGAVIGRYGNRIAGGRFTLDGAAYAVPVNNGPNSLHGGTAGFDKQLWSATPIGTNAVELNHVSPDGDQGYPGTLTVSVRYTVTDDQALRIDYQATTDAPTVANLTNHSYFNLAGAGDVYGHLVQINASHFTPVDAALIPTGDLAPVAGTPLDFRRPVAVGARIRDAHPQLRHAGGYDHNWVLDHVGDALFSAVHVTEPVTGRTMEVRTTEPGVQFYSGNFLDGTIPGRGGRLYRQGDGLALETQHFPDSPNREAFPSTVLRPGSTYRSTTEYRFGVTA